MADSSPLSSQAKSIHKEALPFTLAGLPLHPIPGDKVELHVAQVERPYSTFPTCSLPQNVHDALGWQDASIAELVHWGTVHFQHSKIKLGASESEYHGRVRKVWERLNDYSPRAVQQNCRLRLTLDIIGDPDIQGDISEILGVCMGVFLAARIFDVPISAISKRGFNTSVRHDFDIQLDNSAVELEVRGRFHKHGALDAAHDVDEKFGRTPTRLHRPDGKQGSVTAVTGAGDYSQRIGILVYPSDKPNRRIPDMEVMDPETPSEPTSDAQRARRTLSHYRDVLVMQNVRIVEELERLIGLSDSDLMGELRTGVSRLTDDINYRRGREVRLFGRTRVQLGDEEFLGTFFDGASAPSWIRGENAPTGKGVFFWGLSRTVFKMLGSLDILSLTSGGSGQQSGMTDSGTVVVLFDDGSLTAWAPSFDLLQEDLAKLKVKGS